MVTAKRQYCAGKKTIMMYSDNFINHKINFQCNQWTQRVVAVIQEKESLKTSTWQSKMMTVKQRHCYGREIMMMYDNNTIAQHFTSNIISNPNEWSHSWEMRKPRKMTKKDNRQRWWWNDAIALGEKQTHRDRMTRGYNED